MKIKDGFKMRTVLGNAMVVAEGANLVNFNKIISLNPSAAMLWENVVGKEFTVADLSRLLQEEYEVDAAIADADAASIAAAWQNAGLLD